MIPTIRFMPEEYASESVHQDTLLVASELFRVNGFLLLENIFSPDFIKTLHASFIKRYRHYSGDGEFSDALPLGDKRHMITVELMPPFNTPLLYANPFALPIIKQILGEDCILGGFGAAVSLPEAADQSVHKDHPRLFNHAVDKLIPTYAVTMMVPLVNLTDTNGATRVWAGSHLEIDEALESIEPEDPHVSIGSCYLMDYSRLIHQGVANHSKEVRPIMYNLYSYPWFRDSKVYSVNNTRAKPDVRRSFLCSLNDNPMIFLENIICA